MVRENLFRNGLKGIAIVMLVPVVLLANGLNLNGVGSRAISMGGAYVGLADDYSAVFWNPAGLTQIKGTSVSFFVTDVIPTATYKFAVYGIDATTVSNHYISGAIGMFWDCHLLDNLKIGIFADVPSGLGAEWDGAELRAFSGQSGKEFEWMSKIGVFNFGPVLAYQVSDKLSLGATVNVAYGIMDMKRPVDMLAGMGPGSDGAMDTQYEEESSGMGTGFSFGALFKPTCGLSLGFAVKTRNTIGFSGSAKNATFGMMGAPTESDFDRDITWPLWVAGGIAVKPMSKLTLTADAQWTQWSATEDVLVTEYKDANWKGAMEASESNKMKLQWEDALQIRFGAEYLLSSCFAVRAGYYHDPAPGPYETANILLPSITNNVVTFGLGLLKGSIGFDLTLEYLMGVERDINQYPATGLPENMPGTHGMDMIVPNLALTYCF